ncbi:uncharacterized protein LOC120128330 [Hibiscus syriacus]|uniref:uncharacterized protein LOC120128330 n=1 Tax=Hibiscus syriacus TaxID=106335 RepID=UPI001920E7ED|nr:uncharacterized protein LOC120128330 [Hibiscus syriacus]
MLHTSSTDLPHSKAVGIKQDDKFFSRLSSKEKNSVGNSSLRVYYGGVSGSIPFTWESQPRTPKHAFSTTSLIPPLAPPPSYYSKSNPKSIKKRSRSGLLRALFGKMMCFNLNEMNNVAPSSPSSLSSASWSLSFEKHRQSSRPSSSFVSRADVGSSSRALARCFAAFGIGSTGKCRACYCWG